MIEVAVKRQLQAAAAAAAETATLRMTSDGFSQDEQTVTTKSGV